MRITSGEALRWRPTWPWRRKQPTGRTPTLGSVPKQLVHALGREQSVPPSTSGVSASADSICVRCLGERGPNRRSSCRTRIAFSPWHCRHFRVLLSSLLGFLSSFRRKPESCPRKGLCREVQDGRERPRPPRVLDPGFRQGDEGFSCEGRNEHPETPDEPSPFA